MTTRFAMRQQYDDEADAEARAHTDIKCEDPTLTVQDAKDNADLNVIVERFGIRDVPVIPLELSMFGDVSEVPSLRDILEIQRIAVEQFNALPVRLRNRFDNSALKMYEFVMNPENAEESVRLGLLVKDEPAPEVPAPVAPVISASSPVPA